MAQSSVLVMFQPHFDVLLDFPQRRITTTWNLTVLYDKKAEYCYWEFHLCVTWNLTVLFDKKSRILLLGISSMRSDSKSHAE